MITYKLTRQNKILIEKRFQDEATDLEREEYIKNRFLGLNNFVQRIYGVKWIPNPYPFGSFRVDSERQLMWLLLQID